MLKDIINANDKFEIITDSKESNKVAKKALELVINKLGKTIEANSTRVGINSTEENIFNIEDRYSVSKAIARFAFDNNVNVEGELAELLMKGILIDTQAELYKVSADGGMEEFNKLQQLTQPHEIFKDVSGKTLEDLEVITYIYKNVKNENGVNTVVIPKSFTSNVENNIDFYIDELFGIMKPNKVVIEFPDRTVTQEKK